MSIPEINFPALVVAELIDKIDGLSAANCYEAPTEALDPSGMKEYVQVIHDGSTPACDSGGNAWGENVGIRISMFLQVKTDRSGRLSDVLSSASHGLIVTRLAITKLMVRNRLDGRLGVGFKFVERTPATAYEEVSGLVSQALRFSGVVYSRLEA